MNIIGKKCCVFLGICRISIGKSNRYNFNDNIISDNNEVLGFV